MTLAEASMRSRPPTADATDWRGQALAEQPITIVIEPPGPLARELHRARAARSCRRR